MFYSEVKSKEQVIKDTVQTWREDFPAFQSKVHGKPLVYLDNAATTLKPRLVSQTMQDYYLYGTANIHRGVHYLSEQATQAFEATRSKVKKFINAKDECEIIFTRGTTESINLVALSYGQTFLHAGDEILISQMEHHSNIVPWQMLCERKGCILKVIPINDEGEIIVDEYETLLSEKTKLVSVVYVSNSLGTVNPVRKLIESAHRVGAIILIDGAQAVSHFPIDLQKLNCDFFAFSGHKLFGPTGTGVLYGKQELLEKMPPVYGGGDMIASVTFEKTTYNKLPFKFEAGTPHIAGVIGLGAAVDYFQSLDLTAIQKHEEDLLAYGTNQFDSIDGLKIIGKAREKKAILSFTLGPIHPHDIGTIVDREGVAIRTGHHCTQPVMEYFGVSATARASLSFYNTKNDIDTLVEALGKVQKIFQ